MGVIVGEGEDMGGVVGLIGRVMGEWGPMGWDG